jgi:hypothetical protein
MAENDESPGLKITVAALLSLTVILAVACYFLYSAYSTANARHLSTLDELSRAKAAQKVLQKQYDDLRTKSMSETSTAVPVKKANEPATPR